MGDIFRVLFKVKPVKASFARLPRQILEQEILTGYIGEKMHRNLYRIHKARKK